MVALPRLAAWEPLDRAPGSRHLKVLEELCYIDPHMVGYRLLVVNELD